MHAPSAINSYIPRTILEKSLVYADEDALVLYMDAVITYGICGCRIRLRTTVKVPAGGELHACYTHSLLPTILRREHLLEGKYFACACPRCSDPTELGTHMSSLKCNKCDNGIVLTLDSLGITIYVYFFLIARQRTIRKYKKRKQKDLYLAAALKIELTEIISVSMSWLDEKQKKW